MMGNQHIFFMPCQVDKKNGGDYDVNSQPSAINNSTLLHFTPPFWSCTEAAVAENRSVVVVVVVGGGGGAFHCPYCSLQSHRAGGLESLLSMEYV